MAFKEYLKLNGKRNHGSAASLMKMTFSGILSKDQEKFDASHAEVV